MTSLFSRVKGQACNSVVRKRRHRRGFSLSFTIFFRSAIYQNNCVWLLLNQSLIVFLSQSKRIFQSLPRILNISKSSKASIMDVKNSDVSLNGRVMVTTNTYFQLYGPETISKK